MNIYSFIPDHRIKASNVSVEMTIEEYLEIAVSVVDENEFQRRKVIQSAIKKSLKKDLLAKCTIPPIVLGIRESALPEIFEFSTFNDKELVEKSIKDKHIIILDGLQRTYVMLELAATSTETEWKKQLVRFEVFVGLKKLGILYRMLTLNTGQTTMSTRHILEILYFEYAEKEIGGLKLIKDKTDESVQNPLLEMKFQDAIQGYNSYLEGKEVPTERAELLEIFSSIDVLGKRIGNPDEFPSFITIYLKSLTSLSDAIGDRFFDDDQMPEEYRINGAPFAKYAQEIFSKSQAITGLGAALNYLKESREQSLQKIDESLQNGFRELNGNEIYLLVSYFQVIKNKSKKVGNDQRYFFKIFFISLLNPEEESYLDIYKSIRKAKERVDDRLDNRL